MQELTPQILRDEAAAFAGIESKYDEPSLFGVTDGKRIGTYLEHKFRSYLTNNYEFEAGNSASGIDFPSLNIDMKVTSIKQPQSSCPYKSARQKIFGLGYGLLVFVYDKFDDHNAQTGRLDMKHTIYVEKERTADFQMTRGVREILERDGNKDDLIAFFTDRNRGQQHRRGCSTRQTSTRIFDHIQRPSMAAAIHAGDKRGWRNRRYP